MTTKIKISDLKNIPHNELVAIVNQAIKLKESRKQKSLTSYLETAHEGQIDFHKADKRIRFFLGSNRSGKSEGGTVEDLWWSLGVHPFRKVRTPNKGLIVVQDFENHCKNILEPKILSRVPPGAIKSAERNQTGAWRKLHMSNGSVIDISSHDQDKKTFEGSDYDWSHFDEPPPQHIFSAVWRGLTDRGGHTWITATPLGLAPWMYQDVIKAESGNDPLRWVRYISIWENAKNIGEGDIDVGKKRISEFLELLPPEEREARSTGKFLHLHGIIFKEFSRKNHIIPAFSWPHDWPIYESIDPHPQKDWAVSWLGSTPSGALILLRSGLFAGVIDEIADHILHERSQIDVQNGRSPRIVQTIIDNYASVPMMQRSHTDPTARRKSVREELEAYIGPAVGGPRVIVAPKNVRSKIELFKSMLHIRDEEARFYAFDIPENERFIYEIENYIWDTKRGGIMNGLKDAPRKVDDDILDSIMQVILTLPKLDGNNNEIIRAMKTDSYRI